MYVTRPLSLYLRNPEALSEPPLKGPGASGFLVIQDEEAESTCCFGLCKDPQIMRLPFPQSNHVLTIQIRIYRGEKWVTYEDDVILIPVLNEPLSSNQYYAIKPHRKHKGKAHVSSRNEDMGTCLCFSFVMDLDPAPFDSHDIYQQFIIRPYEGLCSSGLFYATSPAPDGHPPKFLRRKGWRVYSRKPKKFHLDEAPGIFDRKLRAGLPSFDIDISLQGSSQTLLVGKWYCPFMFIRDGALKDQVKRSVYYEMTLHQRWEQVYACENDQDQDQDQDHDRALIIRNQEETTITSSAHDDKGVLVDLTLKGTAVSVGGKEAKHGNVADGIVWFVGDTDGESCGMGLSLDILERMRWEEESFGWVSGDENGGLRVVKRVEDVPGVKWKRLGCYVLVESFVLKRMDGSLVMSYDFRHSQQIRCKWAY